MNRITLLSIAIAGVLVGAGGIWFASQSRLADVAAERDAALAKARAVAAAAPAPEAFKALETENQQLKIRLDEMRIQLSAAQAAASAAPAAAAAEDDAAAAPLDLTDLLGAMEWGEVEAPPRRGRKGGEGERAPGAPGEAGDAGDRPRWGEGGPWNDPARRAEFEKRGAQMREAVQGYLDGEMAKAADRPDVQQRLTQISDYVNDLQQLKEQLRGMEDSPERDALREQLRQTQSAMRDSVHEQQRYLLEEAVVASGVENPGQARRVATSVRQTMNSPFFQMEPMLSGGRGGGNGRRPGNKAPAQ